MTTTTPTLPDHAAPAVEKTTVYRPLLPALKRRVARIARRAKALGLPVPELTVTGSRWEWEYNAFGVRLYKLHFDHVEVVNPFVGVAGWRLLARIEHGQDLADLVHLVPCAVEHEARAESFRGRGPVCDHCTLDRRRNDTYIVLRESTGEVAQIGRTCLQDYTGHDVLAHFGAGAALAALMREDEERCSRPPEPAYSLSTVVSLTLHCMNLDHGYRPSSHVAPTRGHVRELLDLMHTGRRLSDEERAARDAAVEGIKQHREQAERVISWVPSGFARGSGSYAENMRALYAAGVEGTCLIKHLGYIVSGPSAYDRDHQTDAPSEPRKIPPVIGGRQVITATVIKVDEKHNQYGTRVVMTVRDDEGRAYWGTVPRQLDRMIDGVLGPLGRRIEFTATVEPSDRPDFGFLKRPAKARVLDR